MKIKVISNTIKTDNWIKLVVASGSFGCLKVCAKVYDEGSEYGINGGRVSKLQIRNIKNNGDMETLYEYDRGDSVCKLSGEDAPMLTRIVSFLEKLPAVNA